MDTPNVAVGLGPVGTPPAPWPVGADDRAVRPGPSLIDDGALEQCVLLSLGCPVGIIPAGWERVFDRSVAERCAALAWLRSESRIRADAPPAIVERWAAWVSAHIARVESQIVLLAQVDQWLQAHGIPAVVLKGIPLGAKLYGSWWARTVNDIDLYVAPGQCDEAAEVLRATGWRHLRGAAPADIEFVKQVETAVVMLELHGTLAGRWLADMPFPRPETESMVVCGHRLRVHSGSFTPAYLASHLLQHSERPLLWILDFRTLWTGMLENEREAARACARGARLEGALALAERWVTLIAAIEKGRDAGAVKVLEREVLRPTPTLAFAQLLQSADSATDVWRMLLQLVWPREHRDDPRAVLRFWWERIARRIAPAKGRKSPTGAA